MTQTLYTDVNASVEAGERLRATYFIETPGNLERAVEVVAGEQSTGTFIRVPGETEELRDAHAARVESLEELEPVDAPSLPGAKAPTSQNGGGQYRRGRVVLSFPVANMGPRLANVYSTVMGNLYELKEVSGLKLLDLEFPPSFGKAYLGPRFSSAGTKRFAGVADRPVIGTIVKPSVGLSPDATAALVKTLIEAGLDFIKDDELQANGPHSPFDARVDAVMRVINEHAQKTGKKAMYAFNVTDEIDDMRRHHDKVLGSGGTCVMLCLNSLGPSAVAHFRRDAQLPIHGHRAGWGLYTRSPALGIDFLAYSKIWRLAGVDHLHCNGLRNKFWEPGESSMRSARSLAVPMPGMPGDGFKVMPVLASAQWAGQAPETFEHLKTTDLLYVCGGGIIGHPGGIAAGVRSVQQGWEAAVKGISLEDYAKEHRELREALVAFSKR